MTHTIIRAESPAEQAACYAIRWRVFVEEQGVPPEMEIDAEDAVCHHYLLLNGDMPCAAGRIVYARGMATIGRIAVLADYRGQGMGKELLLRMVKDSVARDALAAIELGAQTSAIGFYEKLGFKPYGALYDDAGIPHIHMRYTL